VTTEELIAYLKGEIEAANGESNVTSEPDYFEGKIFAYGDVLSILEREG
jgi:hypothetical protein